MDRKEHRRMRYERRMNLRKTEAEAQASEVEVALESLHAVLEGCDGEGSRGVRPSTRALEDE